MDEYTEKFNKSFFATLEKSIGELPQQTREELYRPCAIKCVESFVLKEQQRQFTECGGSLDLQYEKYGKSEYFFAEIIERGHVYEMGYPRCLCPMAQAGLALSKIHCECSRQSILYVLNTLLPDKEIDVQIIHTVLGGADECRFRANVK